MVTFCISRSIIEPYFQADGIGREQKSGVQLGVSGEQTHKEENEGRFVRAKFQPTQKIAGQPQLGADRAAFAVAVVIYMRENKQGVKKCDRHGTKRQP
jgi:hypothetical protein